METNPPPTADSLVRLVRREIPDPRVVEAFARLPRAGFVPPAVVADACFDGPLPIAHEQVTTQPTLIARMLAALHLQGTERVLEIGTGLGFQTALLALLAREVHSIERFADLAEEARANLLRAGLTNAVVHVGDGTLGLPSAAPFDAIVVSAAAPHVPPPLVEQLVEGGRLVQPCGPGGLEEVRAFRKESGRLVLESRVTLASFVRLVGAHGLRDER